MKSKLQKSKLFFIFCALFFSAQVTQAQTWNIGTPNATAVTATLTPDGTLTISGTGAIPNWGSPMLVPWDAQRTNIRTVIIEYGVTNIPRFGFSNCSNLSGTIIIPNSVTSIGGSAFSNTSITSVIIGKNVTSIEGGAFFGCTGLTKILVRNTIPPTVMANTFHNVPRTLNLYVPAGSRNIYRTTAIWSEFTNVFEIYTVSATPNANGQILINNEDVESIEIIEGQNATFTIIPNSGYRIERVLFNNIDVTNQLNNNIFTATITQNSVLNVNFVRVHNVSVIQNTGGTVLINNAGISTQEVIHGQSVSFSILPNAGYRINQVMFNGTDVTSQLNNNTFTATITQNSVLNVSFVRVFSVSVIHNTGGTVLIDNVEVSSINVNDGQNVTFRILPNSGHRINQVLLNNVDVTSQVNSGNFTVAITQNSVLQVSFVAVHSVTVTHNAGGRILINNEETASKEVAVGQIVTFNITANAGFEVERVFFNNVDVTSQLNNDNFVTAITQNSVLNVSFRESAPNSINSIFGDNVNVLANAQGILIETRKEVQFAIFSISGQLLYQSAVFGSREIALPAGVYIVSVNNVSEKVIVR